MVKCSKQQSSKIEATSSQSVDDDLHQQTHGISDADAELLSSALVPCLGACRNAVRVLADMYDKYSESTICEAITRGDIQGLDGEVVVDHFVTVAELAGFLGDVETATGLSIIEDMLESDVSLDW